MKKENITDSENRAIHNHLPSGITKKIKQVAVMRKGYLIAILSLSLLLAFLGIEFLMFAFQIGAKYRIISLIIAPATMLTIAVISVSIYKDFKKLDDLYRKVIEKTSNTKKIRNL